MDSRKEKNKRKNSWPFPRSRNRRDYPRTVVTPFQRFLDSRILPRTHFSPLRYSKPNCRYLPRTCCPVEKRDASAWTAATPAIFDKGWRGRCRYGDTRRPRGAARGSLPESASPATSPSFLGITSWNQPFRGGQRPPLSPLLGGAGRGASFSGRTATLFAVKGAAPRVLLLHSAATPWKFKHAFSLRPRVFELCVIASCYRPSFSLSFSLSLSRYVTNPLWEDPLSWRIFGRKTDSNYRKKPIERFSRRINWYDAFSSMIKFHIRVTILVIGDSIRRENVKFKFLGREWESSSRVDDWKIERERENSQFRIFLHFFVVI